MYVMVVHLQRGVWYAGNKFSNAIEKAPQDSGTAGESLLTKGQLLTKAD